MVQTLFRCEECKAVYTDQEIASRCEEHCRTKNACSVQYLKESIGVVSRIGNKI